jgi:hypothetical protein
MASSVYWGASVNICIEPALTDTGIFDWIEVLLTRHINLMWKERAKLRALLRNSHPDKDPTFTVPLRVIVPGTIIVASYYLARASLLMEGLVILGSRPPSTH